MAIRGGADPHATIRGDLVTIHNLRNFDYRTETDFDIRLENRTYDLRKLDSVDLITVYWESKAISFGFQGKDYLAVSIETRKEKGESYSTLAGFFRQYAIYYVGDKCACAHLSPTSRGRLYYRVKGPLGNLRRVFVDYIEAMNDLRERPQFYNTLTTNCTTSVWLHTRMNPESPPLSWKMLLSGYVPDYLYELGRLDTSRPFDELEKYRTSTHAPKLPIKTRRREQ